MVRVLFRIIIVILMIMIMVTVGLMIIIVLSQTTLMMLTSKNDIIRHAQIVTATRTTQNKLGNRELCRQLPWRKQTEVATAFVVCGDRSTRQPPTHAQRERLPGERGVLALFVSDVWSLTMRTAPTSCYLEPSTKPGRLWLKDRSRYNLMY